MDMFSEALADSDWIEIQHGEMTFTFSCMPASIICMEVRRNAQALWDNPGPMMPGQCPECLTQAVLDKLNVKLQKKYGEDANQYMKAIS